MGDSAADAEARCAGCATALSSWYEINGAILCDDCRAKALAKHGASHLPTLIRAGMFGSVAAAFGAGIYYAISEATGKEFGLMSIVLGLMVGFAVRAGSRGRGGWRYQALAMFLCYAAICSTYATRLVSEIHERNVRARASASAPSGTPAAAPSGSLAAAPIQHAATAPVASPAVESRPSPGRILQALATLFLFSLALPFLAGMDNLIGIVIIAIGLYEAWKVNVGPSFSVTGPFMAGETRGG